MSVLVMYVLYLCLLTKIVCGWVYFCYPFSIFTPVGKWLMSQIIEDGCSGGCRHRLVGWLVS